MLVLEDRQRRIDAWKAAVDKIAELPENKALLAEFKKNNKRNFPEKDLFYRNAEKSKNTPDPKEFGFRDAGRLK